MGKSQHRIRMSTMPECKSCGAEIQWVPMESGKPMPVNATPKRFVWVGPDGRGRVSAGFTPHWATCSDPDKHRKQRDLPGTETPQPKRPAGVE